MAEKMTPCTIAPRMSSAKPGVECRVLFGNDVSGRSLAGSVTVRGRIYCHGVIVGLAQMTKRLARALAQAPLQTRFSRANRLTKLYSASNANLLKRKQLQILQVNL
jgi:hypothetical protein